MKTYIPLDRLKRSRDSGSALYNMHPTDVLGRAGGGVSTRSTQTIRNKEHQLNPLQPDLHQLLFSVLIGFKWVQWKIPGDRLCNVAEL